MFTGSPRGAGASACVYSLIETPKANRLDLFKHLQCLLMLIPGSNYKTNKAPMNGLIPWSDLMQAKCK
jgi:transposase